MAVLPYHAVFDILSRTTVKSICRFRCVSRAWRDLISSPIFAAAHSSRHGPLLVYAGSFPEEEPDEGRDLRLMDMEGNVVRVIKGVGGYGTLCNTSLDDLICVNGANGASCERVSVVDPATGEVLVTCPQQDVLEHDMPPYVAIRYYTIFGFGRAATSGRYKLVRILSDNTSEILTLGEEAQGWRKTPPPIARLYEEQGSPVTIDGVMYFLVGGEVRNDDDDTLVCLDLETEQWKVVDGPQRSSVRDSNVWSRTLAIRITELNGALCMVQPVCDHTSWDRVPADDAFTNIWILDNSRKNWTKRYTIPMAPSACRYMPLRVMPDGGKLLLQCSFNEGQLYSSRVGRYVVLQTYDPLTNICTDIKGAPKDLAGRIGLCTFGLDHPVCAKSLLALFLDQALLFFRK